LTAPKETKRSFEPRPFCGIKVRIAFSIKVTILASIILVTLNDCFGLFYDEGYFGNRLSTGKGRQYLFYRKNELPDGVRRCML
jgi:hypothetical protein